MRIGGYYFLRRLFEMGRNFISRMLCAMLVTLALTSANITIGYADQSKVAQAIYITVSKACGCTLDRCRAGDWVVERVFVGEKKALLKRLDYATEKDAAREYITKYRLAMPPSLLFLDKDGNLLWRADGELDQDQVAEKLKEFGA
jgi:hypothetical protein